MEALIGFIAGYLVGSREGKAGLDRLRESVDAIRRSPDVRRIAIEAISVAQSAAQDGSRRGFGGIGAGMARALINRATGDGQREDSPAAA